MGPALFTTLSVVNDKDLILTNLNKEEISWLCSWNIIVTAYSIKEELQEPGLRAANWDSVSPRLTFCVSQLSLPVLGFILRISFQSSLCGRKCGH